MSHSLCSPRAVPPTPSKQPDLTLCPPTTGAVGCSSITVATLLGLQGPINLAQPDVTLRLIVVIPCQTESLPGGMPRRFYFAREVALSKRNALTPYALPKRLYLGPTSMDHEMAAVICILAKEWDPCPNFTCAAGVGLL